MFMGDVLAQLLLPQYGAGLVPAGGGGAACSDVQLWAAAYMEVLDHASDNPQVTI